MPRTTANSRRENHITTQPQVKATATEQKIPEMMVSDFELLIYSPRLRATSAPPSYMVNSATTTAAPSNSNTRDTVVEVGKPKVLNKSSRMTSVSITARNNIITPWKLNCDGINTPLRAISIIPPESDAPSTIPTAATASTTPRRAALQPTAEFRKLAASFDTPTTRSNTASKSRMPNIAIYISFICPHSTTPAPCPARFLV